MIGLPAIEYFVKNGHITYPQYYEIKMDLKEHEQKKFPDILIEYGIYNERQIAEIMAAYFGVPFFDIEKWAESDETKKELMKDVPLTVAKKYCACIVGWQGRRFVVVTDEPHNFEMMDTLRGFTGHDIVAKMGVPSAILKEIDKVYGVKEPEPPDEDDDEEEEETITIEKAARYFNVGLCKVAEVNPPKKLLKKIPYETAVKYCCFPISDHGDTVYFAADNPTKTETYDALKELVGGKVVFRLAGWKDILKKIDQLYGKDKID